MLAYHWSKGESASEAYKWPNGCLLLAVCGEIEYDVRISLTWFPSSRSIGQKEFHFDVEILQ